MFDLRLEKLKKASSLYLKFQNLLISLQPTFLNTKIKTRYYKEILNSPTLETRQSIF